MRNTLTTFALLAAVALADYGVALKARPARTLVMTAIFCAPVPGAGLIAVGLGKVWR